MKTAIAVVICILLLPGPCSGIHRHPEAESVVSPGPPIEAQNQDQPAGKALTITGMQYAPHWKCFAEIKIANFPECSRQVRDELAEWFQPVENGGLGVDFANLGMFQPKPKDNFAFAVGYKSAGYVMCGADDIQIVYNSAKWKPVDLTAVQMALTDATMHPNLPHTPLMRDDTEGSRALNEVRDDILAIMEKIEDIESQFQISRKIKGKVMMSSKPTAIGKTRTTLTYKQDQSSYKSSDPARKGELKNLITGCFTLGVEGLPDRAYGVGVFERTDATKERVVVVGAHFAHPPGVQGSSKNQAHVDEATHRARDPMAKLGKIIKGIFKTLNKGVGLKQIFLVDTNYDIPKNPEASVCHWTETVRQPTVWKQKNPDNLKQNGPHPGRSSIDLYDAMGLGKGLGIYDTDNFCRENEFHGTCCADNAVPVHLVTKDAPAEVRELLKQKIETDPTFKEEIRDGLVGSTEFGAGEIQYPLCFDRTIAAGFKGAKYVTILPQDSKFDDKGEEALRPSGEKLKSNDLEGYNQLDNIIKTNVGAHHKAIATLITYSSETYNSAAIEDEKAYQI